MDFIARAGSVIERSHRVAGLLVLCLFGVSFILFSQWQQNAKLVMEIEQIRKDLPIYVIPGSTAGEYAPSRRDMLLDYFSNHITQSLNTYTYASFRDQYLEIRNLFSTKFLNYSDEYYTKLYNEIQSLERSALFVPMRNFTLIQELEADALTGQRRFLVTIIGNKQFILGTKVIEIHPLQIDLTIVRSEFSKTNPFGFRVEAIKETQLTEGDLNKIKKERGIK